MMVNDGIWAEAKRMWRTCSMLGNVKYPRRSLMRNSNLINANKRLHSRQLRMYALQNPIDERKCLYAARFECKKTT
jgi:hypothetical protein